ncbi:synaptotagmin-11-like isoform X2 [Oscarella lobularis]
MEIAIVGVSVGIGAALFLILCLCLCYRKRGRGRKKGQVRQRWSIRQSPTGIPTKSVSITNMSSSSLFSPPVPSGESSSSSLRRMMGRYDSSGIKTTSSFHSLPRSPSIPQSVDRPASTLPRMRRYQLHSLAFDDPDSPAAEQSSRTRKVSRSAPSSPRRGRKFGLQTSFGTTSLHSSQSSISFGGGCTDRPIRGAGAVQVVLAYSVNEKVLQVTVVRATGLPDYDDAGGWYVKIYVIDPPRQCRKGKTKIVKNSREPQFDEKFEFGKIDSFKEVTGKDLLVQVVRHRGQMAGRKAIIGEAKVHLFQVQQEILKQSELWINLPRNWEVDDYRGELDVTLGLCKTGSSISVIVNKGRNIPDVKQTIFVQISVYHYRHLISDKRKTKRIKCTTQPVFNENFAFDVSAYRLDDLQVLFELKQNAKTSPAHHRVIGHTAIGAHSVAEHEKQHWDDIVLTPGKLICRSHQLRKGKFNYDRIR